jgi:hypothetical protein
MMKTALLAGMFLAGVIAFTGCGASDTTQRSGADDALTVSLPRSTTLMNYSEVEAVLESAETLYEPIYSMKLFIVAVTAKGGQSAVIEPGQRVVATPLYDMDAAGNVDLTIPRNAALNAIRQLPAGSKFKGTLAVTNKGNWQLLSVITP